MKTMRDAEVRLTGDLLKKYESAMAVEEARNRRGSTSAHIEFTVDELVFQHPLSPDGLQHRYRSPTVNEWVCFAPGYPAWETVA